MQPSRCPWLAFGAGAADAGVRLLCLPFAGGGASAYLGWRRHLPGVAVAPLQYPGHETRLSERPLVSLDAMLAGLADAVAPWLDRPYALFGCSLGARLAFALVRQLAERGLPPPCGLLVAASAPPGRPVVADTAGLDDGAFQRLVRSYGGIPPELDADPGFWTMALPVLRADFALAAQPLPGPGPGHPLDCPVVAYAGRADALATPLAMAGWSAMTTGGSRLHCFDGGHFFLQSAPDFLDTLSADIDRLRLGAAACLVPA